MYVYVYMCVYIREFRNTKKTRTLQLKMIEIDTVQVQLNYWFLFKKKNGKKIKFL